MAESNKEKNVLQAMYTKNTFVKIKQCLEIDKMLFSFVDMNTKEHIDCYMDAEEFGVLLMRKIYDGSLKYEIDAEKALGAQYPRAVWTSPIGGNSTGNNGMPISRSFNIAPGSSAPIVITASTYPAVKSETGAFVAIKNSKPLKIIRVACKYEDLLMMANRWKYLEKDYMSKKYTMENMKSDYTPTNENNNQKQNNYQQQNSYTQQNYYPQQNNYQQQNGYYQQNSYQQQNNYQQQNPYSNNYQLPQQNNQ